MLPDGCGSVHREVRAKVIHGRVGLPEQVELVVRPWNQAGRQRHRAGVGAVQDRQRRQVSYEYAAFRAVPGAGQEYLIVLDSIDRTRFR